MTTLTRKPVPGYYVKANGTVVMSLDVFRAANPHDVVKALNTMNRARTQKTPTPRDRENRDLTIALYIGNASDRNNG